MQLAPDVNLYARVATGFRAPSFGAPQPVRRRCRCRSPAPRRTSPTRPASRRRCSTAAPRSPLTSTTIDVSHQQLTAVGGAANVTQLINAEQTIGKGAELDFEAHPLPNLTVNLSGSYNDTRIEDPDASLWPPASTGARRRRRCTPLNPLEPRGTGADQRQSTAAGAEVDRRLLAALRTPWARASSTSTPTCPIAARSTSSSTRKRSSSAHRCSRAALRMGYTWDQSKYEVAAFCRNCTNEIRVHRRHQLRERDRHYQ